MFALSAFPTHKRQRLSCLADWGAFLRPPVHPFNGAVSVSNGSVGCQWCVSCHFLWERWLQGMTPTDIYLVDWNGWLLPALKSGGSDGERRRAFMEAPHSLGGPKYRPGCRVEMCDESVYSWPFTKRDFQWPILPRFGAHIHICTVVIACSFHIPWPPTLPRSPRVPLLQADRNKAQLQ
jgi:hypothetical protein